MLDLFHPFLRLQHMLYTYHKFDLMKRLQNRYFVCLRDSNKCLTNTAKLGIKVPNNRFV